MATDDPGREPAVLAPAKPTTAGAESDASREERALRELATRQVERVHSFKLHLISFAGGVVALGVIWMLSEYFQDNRWPTRFADADNGDPGTWNPWFFYAVAVWAIVVGVHAVKTYGRRPPTEAEIQREMERLASRR